MSTPTSQPKYYYHALVRTSSSSVRKAIPEWHSPSSTEPELESAGHIGDQASGGGLTRSDSFKGGSHSDSCAGGEKAVDLPHVSGIFQDIVSSFTENVFFDNDEPFCFFRNIRFNLKVIGHSGDQAVQNHMIQQVLKGLNDNNNGGAKPSISGQSGGGLTRSDSFKGGSNGDSCAGGEKVVDLPHVSDIFLDIVSDLTENGFFNNDEPGWKEHRVEDEVTHLRKTFSMLQACKELKSSRLFLKLLEAVLKTGNRMNVGTIRGGAKAFKLNTLLKLSDVKGTDGKTTLLHFVVQEIVRSEGVRVSESIIGKINQKASQEALKIEKKTRNMGLELVASLSNELCNVKKTATSLSQDMSRLRRLVDKYLLMEEKSCSFVESMKSFLTTAQKHLEEVEEEERKSLDLVKEITEYFQRNMSKDEVNPLRIFVIVRDFLAMLDFVCRELRRSICCGQSNPLAPFQ
ncbi:formin-like protein 11 [Tanacetum coccineum]